MQVPHILTKISKYLHQKNAKAIIVGGAVRDYFLKMPLKDYDIEVYGLETIEALEEVLALFGSVNSVGKSFGVLKFVYQGETYDFALPRKETKVGQGHKGFSVTTNAHLDFNHAFKRRDFTLNAIGYDIEKKVYIDPYQGKDDLKAKVLRHINTQTFVQDPLRVYRGVQFSSRFSFALLNETKLLCQSMVAQGMLLELPKERVYMEWKKFLLKSQKPSEGFECMRTLGILKRHFPELHALIGVVQSPKWHPEGDVWTHTMMTVDEMAILLRSEALKYKEEKEKLRFLFAILCHDLGKACSTTIETDGSIRSIGHEKTGLELSKTFMYRLTDEHDFIESLLPLIEHHLKPSQFYAAKSSAKAIRKLATKVNIESLVMIAKADFLGRTTPKSLTRIYEAGDWLLQKASELKVKTHPLERLLQGRDLIHLGFMPSPKFKKMIDAVYTEQLEGNITTHDEALGYVKKHFISKNHENKG